MPTSIPRLCRSIPSVYLPTKLENTSPSAQASVAGVRFAMGPPCQLRFRGSAAPSQSRAFASRWGRRANFDSAALPLHLSRGRSLRDGAAVPTSIPRLCRSISVAGVRFAMGPPCATSIPRLCRSISVAGIRPMEKQKQGPGRMQALFRVPVSASPHGSLPSRKL